MKKTMIYAIVFLLLAGGIALPFIVYQINRADHCTTECFTKLEEAKEVTIRKKPQWFKKEFAVIVENETVAYIEGKTIKAFGDAFALTAPDQKEVWLEEQGRKKFPIKNGGLKYDRKSMLVQGEAERGFLYERLTLVGTAIELRNPDNEEKALLKGDVVKLTSKFTITNPSEEIEFAQAKKRFRPLIESVYDVNIHDNS